MENTSPAAFRRSVFYEVLAKHLFCLPLSLFLPLRNQAKVNPLILAGPYYNFCHNDVTLLLIPQKSGPECKAAHWAELCTVGLSQDFQHLLNAVPWVWQRHCR